MPLAAGDLWLACVPLRHIAGLSILLRCLEAGAGVSIHDGFDAARVWRDLRGQPVTHLSLVPAMLHQLLQVAAGQPPPARLRCVLIGGAALDPSLAARAQAAGWPLCVSYGMSETASQIATECGALAGCEAGRVGVPLAGFALRLEGLGDARRIWLRGPALMLGYAAPGLAPGRGLADGWLLTGDIGRCDDGVLRLRGRADDMLISGGENLHPAEVEPVLRAAPGVDDAALAAVADPVWGDLLVAVFSGSATPDSVAAHCRRHLAGARRPRHFCQLERLPYTASGKLDRLALRDLAAAAVRVSVRR
jgi:O-succinylbenzoic acid--CoA ligase